MKKWFFCLCAVLAVSLCPAADNDVRWETANKFYLEGDYENAARTYTEILDSGYSSSALFFNLGNACYKAGENGRAILNYNRALRLDPFNKDIKHNLAMANALVTTRIDPVPQFFLTQWSESVRSLLSSDGWARLSMALAAVTFVALAIFIFSISPRVRKIFFTISILGLIGFLVSLNFSNRQKNVILRSGEAIVLYNATAVKSSPDTNSDDLFILGEGTKVVVLERLGNWSEVEIASGNRGWLESGKVELIDLSAVPAKN